MSVLGINRRNALIMDMNSRKANRRADDKLATKQALREAGLPVSRTLLTLADLGEVTSADFASELPDQWVLKPNKGRQGNGILIAHEREGDRWRIGEDKWVDAEGVRALARKIVLGDHAGSGTRNDTAFFEPLIRPDAGLAPVSKHGLPDIRVIVVDGEAVMAMLRVPTLQSGGRANLHKGALGLALDLDDGSVFHIVSEDGELAEDDERREGLDGFKVPQWARIIEVAQACAKPSVLGFLGADLVLDRDEGVLVLEINAHPGIEIQNVNRDGLRDRAQKVIGKN